MGIFGKSVHLRVADDVAGAKPGGTDAESWYYGLNADRLPRGAWLARLRVNQSWQAAKEYADDIFPGTSVDLAGEGQAIRIGRVSGGLVVDTSSTEGLVEAFSSSSPPEACYVLGEVWRDAVREEIVILLVPRKITVRIGASLPPSWTVVPQPPTHEELTAKAEAAEAAKSRQASMRKLSKKYPYAGKIAKLALSTRAVTPAQAEELLDIISDLEGFDTSELLAAGFVVSDAGGSDWLYALSDVANALTEVIDSEDADERADAADMAAVEAEELRRFFVEDYRQK